MNILNRHSLLIVGVVFHLVYLWSIFDIYFISPLTHGMQQHLSTPEPPAKRLFLIVGDGLRADKCFDQVVHPANGEKMYLAPHLRETVKKRATFGVSHTRMPTESRPGHVAMIAGFYEDVSAVTKGWKENPVDFDSVLNQTYHTWSFGSPDILPMFADGASDRDRIETFMYGHEFEDFTKSSIELDRFVFDHVRDLFQRGKEDEDLDKQLRSDKVVFFLHLLGCDTAGHSYRPYSAEYYDNIRYIDSEIAKLEKLVNEYYNDDKTVFLFTADHGMSDFGSHGDGHPDNTRTPIIAWGAGINSPVKGELGDHDEYSEPWDLNEVKRNDINQADIAPLMAYLVGLNYPANSVGELPIDFLQTSVHSKLQALFTNCLEIVEQFRVKEATQKQVQIKFTPYPEFEGEHNSIDERLARIQELINSDSDTDHRRAITETEELMRLALEGLNYLQTYNWLFLRTMISFGFFGWILFSITAFLNMFVVPERSNISVNSVVRNVSLVILSGMWIMFFIEKSPLNYYLYSVFPILFWSVILSHYQTLVNGIKLLAVRANAKFPFTYGVAVLIMILVFMEAMVYGYFSREIFTVMFLILSVWPYLQDFTLAVDHKKYSLLWTCACIFNSVFTLLPANKVESLPLITLGAVLMIAGGAAGIYSLKNNSGINLNPLTEKILFVQLLIVVATYMVTQRTVISLQNREGLALWQQVSGWACLISSAVVPLFHIFAANHNSDVRLLILFLFFSVPFIILTVSYEGLFFVGFSSVLFAWIRLERIFHEGDGTREKGISLKFIRIALFSFFFAQVGFFGTGNIASISSFTLDSVYRLIPIFDPFPMGALLMFKILLPFALLSFVLGILNITLNVEESTLFTIVISLSDIMSLNFFFLVKREGSWLDIGTSISNYCIACLMSLFIIGLEYVSALMVGGIKTQETIVSRKKAD